MWNRSPKTSVTQKKQPTKLNLMRSASALENYNVYNLDFIARYFCIQKFPRKLRETGAVQDLEWEQLCFSRRATWKLRAATTQILSTSLKWQIQEFKHQHFPLPKRSIFCFTSPLNQALLVQRWGAWGRQGLTPASLLGTGNTSCLYGM